MMIVFSGLDCSGKSTQIEILSSSLIENNKKVFKFWSRGGYTQGMQRLKDLSRFLLGKKLPKAGKSKSREQSFQRPLVRKVWLSLAIIDLIFFYSIWLRLKKWMGHVVICDRYIIDTEVDFKLNFPMENVSNWWLWKLMKWMALKPNCHFVSLIPVAVSVVRSTQKFEPFPDSPEVLAQRLDAYERGLKSDTNLIFIDGMLPIPEVSIKVNQIISEKNSKG